MHGRDQDAPAGAGPGPAGIPPGVPPPPPPSDPGTRELSLADVWWMLVRGRWWIGGSVLACTLAAVFLALTATPIYRAQALLQAVNKEQENGGLLAQVGGLASLAGLQLGGGNAQQMALAVLKSRRFLGGFIRDLDLLPTLFPERWDAAAGRWKEGPQEGPPTMWEAVDRFRDDILRVSEDRITGMVTLAVEWRDREQAAKWVGELASRLNATMRQSVIADAEKRMDYLRVQLAQASNVELRRAIANVMEQEIKRAALAQGNDEFVFRVIDPPVVPPAWYPVRPRKALMVVLGMILGAVLGVALALAWQAFQALRGATRPPARPAPSP